MPIAKKKTIPPHWNLQKRRKVLFSSQQDMADAAKLGRGRLTLYIIQQIETGRARDIVRISEYLEMLGYELRPYRLL